MGHQAKPFGRLTEALDQIEAWEIYLTTGGLARCAAWGDIFTQHTTSVRISSTGTPGNLRAAAAHLPLVGVLSLRLRPKIFASRTDIDFLDVCTSPAYRLSAVEIGARYGKRVLVQKPMAIDLDTAARMISIAQPASIQLGAVSQHRFDDSILFSNELLMHAVLGTLSRPTYALSGIAGMSITLGERKLDGWLVFILRARNTVLPLLKINSETDFLRAVQVGSAPHWVRASSRHFLMLTAVLLLRR